MIQWEWLAFEDFDIHRLYDLMKLRQEVFVIEQDSVYLDADDRDQESLHLLGMEGNRPVAYLRILPPGLKYEAVSIGRVLTHRQYRDLGLGRELIRRAIAKAEETYPGQDLVLSGQVYLKSFYEHYGFRAIGQPYEEDGIPHCFMRRTVVPNEST